MDELLLAHYEQLKAIHDRIEDIIRDNKVIVPCDARMTTLLDDVRKMRDDAKREYDTF